MNASRSGDIAEQTATIWLARQGYEVFQNFGCTGPIDLVAVNPETGETIFIDVKKYGTYVLQDGTVRVNRPCVASHPKNYRVQVNLGVKYLLADIKTGECYWSEPATPRTAVIDNQGCQPSNRLRAC